MRFGPARSPTMSACFGFARATRFDSELAGVDPRVTPSGASSLPPGPRTVPGNAPQSLSGFPVKIVHREQGFFLVRGRRDSSPMFDKMKFA